MKKSFLIVNEFSTPNFAKKESGGKGYNLYLLKNNKINVPDFITLPTQFFDYFKGQTGIDAYMQNILVDQHLSMKEISEKISLKITETKVPIELESAIKEIYNKLNKKLISVRSSAHDEDSAVHSFAGQLSSFLYISDFEHTLKSIKEC